MSKLYTPQSDNLIPLGSVAGAAAPVAANPRDGFQLAAGTWYVELGSSEGPMTDAILAAFAASFNAAFAATFTLQSTCFPASPQGHGQGVDVTPWQAATNRWFPESLVAASVLSAGGAGNAYAAPTFTAGGTNLGGFLGYLANAGARRYRLAVVVTTAGTLRVGMCAKD
jgi:hypothetical protein